MLNVKQGGIKYLFWVFGMTWPEIKTQSPGPLANTELIRQMAQLEHHIINDKKWILCGDTWYHIKVFEFLVLESDPWKHNCEKINIYKEKGIVIWNHIMVYISWGFVWFLFNGKSTFVVYLIPKSSLPKNNIRIIEPIAGGGVSRGR